MRLVTWNVNSIRARLPRVLGLLEECSPDVVCLQEMKCSPERVPRSTLDSAGYQVISHCEGRWNGVAVVVHRAVDVGEVVLGLEGEPAPTEARWVEADVDGIRVVSAYAPSGARDLAGKLRFLEAAAARTAQLVRRGPLVLAGDLNVALTDHDAAVTFIGASTHVTTEERAGVQAIIDAGVVDVYRLLHPVEASERAQQPAPEQPAEPDARLQQRRKAGFTWWDYRAGAFHRNLGMRLDYLLLSPDLVVRDCRVELDYRRIDKAGAKPSDHAPLRVDFTRRFADSTPSDDGFVQ